MFLFCYTVHNVYHHWSHCINVLTTDNKLQPFLNHDVNLTGYHCDSRHLCGRFTLCGRVVNIRRASRLCLQYRSHSLGSAAVANFCLVAEKTCLDEKCFRSVNFCIQTTNSIFFLFVLILCCLWNQSVTNLILNHFDLLIVVAFHRHVPFLFSSYIHTSHLFCYSTNNFTNIVYKRWQPQTCLKWHVTNVYFFCYFFILLFFNAFRKG